MVLYAPKGPQRSSKRRPMPKQIKEEDNAAILAAVERHPGGASRGDIERALPKELAPRTLQFRLRNLVNAGRLFTEGEGRALRYRLPREEAPQKSARVEAAQEEATVVPISAAGSEVRRYVSRPVAARTPVGYNRGFLDEYRPNERSYLSEKERASLGTIGTRHIVAEAAGTYASEI